MITREEALNDAAERHLNQPIGISFRRRDWFIIAMLMIAMKGGMFGKLPGTGIAKMLDKICGACGKSEREIMQMVSKWGGVDV